MSCQISPYIAKPGNLAFMFALAPSSTTATVTGTVSVASGSAALTWSVPQLSLVGQKLTIAGDSSSTTYTIIAGAGTTYTINPVYGGSSNAVAAAPTMLPYTPTSVIQTVASNPTFSVQWGGEGSPQAIEIWANPVYTPATLQWPFAVYQLLCGGVASVLVQSPGHSYSASPTLTQSGATGTPPTFGPITVTGGVTSYVVGSGGAFYSSKPLVIVAPSEILLAGTITSGSTAVTGISSTVGLIPGMTVFGTGPTPNAIQAVTGSTTLTLALPATINGSPTLQFQGKLAEASCTVVGGVITAVNVFLPGSGYILGSPPSVQILDPSGSGASITAVVTRTIGWIPVIAPGSANTSNITLAITDADGSGATAACFMTGVGPSDVVTYSAASSWLTAAAGTAPTATNVSVPNYAGQLEPGVGTFLGFNAPADHKVMQLGWNISGTLGANSISTTCFPGNWMKRIANPSNWQTISYDQRPLTISATADAPLSWIISNPFPNMIDQLDEFSSAPPGVSGFFPSPEGVWTYINDDTDQSSPLEIALTTTGVVSTVFTEGTLTTGLTGTTLTDGGTGFTTIPQVNVIGNGTGATAYALINNGKVIAVYPKAVGQGYTGPITIEIIGGNNDATATATVGSVISGRAWQFTILRNNQVDNLNITFNAWKTTGGTYSYSATNERLYSPSASAAHNLAALIAADSNGIEQFNADCSTVIGSPNKYPYVDRCIDGLTGFDGNTNNIVTAEDLKSLDSYSYFVLPIRPPDVVATAPTTARQISVNTIRTYSLGVGSVSALTLALGGSVYDVDNVPTLAINSSTGGTGAAGHVTVSEEFHSLSSVVLDSPGTGYSQDTTTYVLSYGDGEITGLVGYPAGWDVTWGNPNVYLAGKYGGNGTPTPDWTGYGSGSLGGPFYITPTSIGWLNPHPEDPTAFVAGEMVCTAPHNLKATQAVSLSTNSGFFSQSDGPSMIVTNQTFPGDSGARYYFNVWPTGPDTIAFFFLPLTPVTSGSGPGLPGNINNIAGTFTVDYVLDFVVPESQGSIGIFGYVEYCKMVSSFPGTSPIITLPVGATDDCLTQIGHDVLNNTTPGGKVRLEFGNEIWSFTSATFNILNMANLGLWNGASDQITSYVVRAGQAFALIQAVFDAAGRGGELIYMLGSIFVDTGYSSELLTVAAAVSVRGDELQVAPYQNFPTAASGNQGEETNLDIAANLLFTQSPLSTEQNQPNPWTFEMMNTIYRHNIVYCEYNRLSYLGHQQACNAYAIATGNPVPRIVGYEGGPASVVPGGAGEGGKDPYGNEGYDQVWHDIHSDPSRYFVEQAYYQTAQQGGQYYQPVFYLAGAPNPPFANDYQLAIYNGQPFGKGDGSTASNGVAITNQTWRDSQVARFEMNASTAIQAWQDWVGGISPTPTPTPTMATLSGPSTCVLGTPSTAFAVTLDEPAQSGGVSCTITSSVGGDTITGAPVVIGDGLSDGTFTITASSVGVRTITLTGTTPTLTIAGSPITLTASPTPTPTPPPIALNPYVTISVGQSGVVITNPAATILIGTSGKIVILP